MLEYDHGLGVCWRFFLLWRKGLDCCTLSLPSLPRHPTLETKTITEEEVEEEEYNKA